MTNLKCSVTNCVYNDSHLCSKDEINVGGEHAKEQSCTCCESFCNCNHAQLLQKMSVKQPLHRRKSAVKQ